MDIGDLAYPILALAFTALSALTKKKKRTSGSKAPKRNVFEDFFKEEETFDDPVLAQAESQADALNDYTEDCTEDEEIILDDRTRSDNEYAIYLKKAQDASVSEPIKPKLKKQTQQKVNNNVLGDLHSPGEMRRAFIYSEIFKPKF